MLGLRLAPLFNVFLSMGTKLQYFLNLKFSYSNIKLDIAHKSNNVDNYFWLLIQDLMHFPDKNN